MDHLLDSHLIFMYLESKLKQSKSVEIISYLWITNCKFMDMAESQPAEMEDVLHVFYV